MRIWGAGLEGGPQIASVLSQFGGWDWLGSMSVDGFAFSGPMGWVISLRRRRPGVLDFSQEE